MVPSHRECTQEGGGTLASIPCQKAGHMLQSTVRVESQTLSDPRYDPAMAI